MLQGPKAQGVTNFSFFVCPCHPPFAVCKLSSERLNLDTPARM